MQKAEVLLLAVDGLEPELVRRWVAQGALPNLAKLIDGGLMATIDCVVPSTSPIVWTTVASGTSPAEHGITGFTIDGTPVNVSHRKRPTFWNILTAQELRIATVGWMVTWPAESDSGIIISDYAWWKNPDDEPGAMLSPKGIVDFDAHRSHLEDGRDIIPKFSDYAYDGDFESKPTDGFEYRLNYLLRERLAKIFRRDATNTSIALEVARNNDLDLLAVYLQGADYVGHGFWQWFEPEPFRKAGWEVRPKDVDALSQVIFRYYRHLDAVVGELVSAVADDALIILLSDHGFQAWPSAPDFNNLSHEARFLSGKHRGEAVLIMSGPQVRKGAQPREAITHFDIFPTLLFAVDQPRALDHRGRVLVEFFTDAMLAGRPDRSVATYRTGLSPVAVAPRRSKADDRILEELRSLGYIE